MKRVQVSLGQVHPALVRNMAEAMTGKARMIDKKVNGESALMRDPQAHHASLLVLTTRGGLISISLESRAQVQAGTAFIV